MSKTNHTTETTVVKHIDNTRSADFRYSIDFATNKKRWIYIPKLLDNFNKLLLPNAVKNNYAQTINNNLKNIFITSKRKRSLNETDDGEGFVQGISESLFSAKFVRKFSALGAVVDILLRMQWLWKV